MSDKTSTITSIKNTLKAIGAGILAVLGFVFFFLVKNRSQAETDARLAETAKKDAQLKVQQADTQKMISEIDAGIEKARLEREAIREKEKNMTLAERAERMRKKLGQP